MIEFLNVLFKDSSTSVGETKALHIIDKPLCSCRDFIRRLVVCYTLEVSARLGIDKLAAPE